MAKCEKCGSEQDGKFCEECGKPMESAGESSAVKSYGKHIVVAVVVLLSVVGVAFVLNQGNQAPVASAEVTTLENNECSGSTCAVTETKEKEPVRTESETRTLVASIQGMTCGSCVAGIERKVGALDGVVSVDVYLREKRGEVVYDPASVSKQTIMDTITNYGYPASEVSGTPSNKVVQPSGGSGGGCGCGCGG
jgi:copper chaperone CopZ